MAVTDNDCNRGTNGVLKQQTTGTRHVMGILLITQGPLHERSQGFTVAMPAGRAGRPVQPGSEGVTTARWSGDVP